MRARHRHLNPKSVGASVAFDSRYLNQSDASAVSLWPDRSGNARDLSQATASARPTYKTAIQGGNGVVRFDGADDAMETTSYSDSCIVTGIAVFQSAQSSAGYLFERSSNYNSNSYAYLISMESSTAFFFGVKTPSGYVAANFTTRSASFNIATFTYNGDDGSYAVFQNGTALTRAYLGGSFFQAHATGSLTAPSYVGRRGTSSTQFNGDVGMIYTIPSYVSDSLRKRLSHHAAFSFKLACN